MLPSARNVRPLLVLIGNTKLISWWSWIFRGDSQNYQVWWIRRRETKGERERSANRPAPAMLIQSLQISSQLDPTNSQNSDGKIIFFFFTSLLKWHGCKHSISMGQFWRQYFYRNCNFNIELENYYYQAIKTARFLVQYFALIFQYELKIFICDSQTLKYKYVNNLF